jgi:hypothetical protein
MVRGAMMSQIGQSLFRPKDVARNRSATVACVNANAQLATPAKTAKSTSTTVPQNPARMGDNVKTV